ncbi:MAG: site-specific integrase [Oscillospiraceae bacterium]
MTQENLLNVLNFITTVECSDEQKKALLEMAANTITISKLSSLMQDGNDNKNKASDNNEVGIVRFTKKEISLMPKTFRKQFRTAGCTAHVLRRKSGKNTWNYMIRYRKGGYYIVATSNDLEEAKRKFIEKLHAADELKRQQDIAKVTGMPVTPSPLLKQPEEVNGIPTTFDKFADYYFEKFYKRKVCDETFRVTLSNYKNHVLPHFGSMRLSSVTADKCQQLLDSLIDQDKLRTEENVYTMLNMLFKAAIKHAIMEHNPMDMVFHTKHEREHGKALTKEEERKLLTETADTPYQQMFAVALYTGLRPNEYKTAYIENEFIVANNSKRKNGKTELKKIPITPMLAPYVKEGDELKFYRLEQIRHKFNSILPWHKLYDLRTTFYTRCTECSIAEVAIKKYVGHTLGGLADTYADLSDEFLIKEGQKLRY